VDQSLRVGQLARGHRDRITQILDATRVFRPEEVEVALELFDETFPSDASRSGAADASSSAPSTGDAGDSEQSTDYRLPSTDCSATGYRLPATGYSFLGAFTPDDELVGYACYGPTPDTDRTFDLYWIAVDPDAQGGGGGTRLLTEVERRLQGQNARMLIVETSSRSEYAPTRHFYEKRGYAEAARVREFYAPLDDRIIFTKRFHSPEGGERCSNE
jgi:ribosomal protein S18 acetylase RimI-like enzyme